MQIAKRAIWYLVQFTSVVFFFVIGGALLQWSSTISYEEAHARFGERVPKNCDAFVVSGKSVSPSHPYFCHTFKSHRIGDDIELFVFIWGFIGNFCILYASGKPRRAFPLSL